MKADLLTKKRSLKAAKPNARNPRKVTDKKLQLLQDALTEFGDLGGIVVNRRFGDRIVGGHQRQKAFAALRTDNVVIEKEYAHSTPTGTVAEGHVEHRGERFAYRIVDWPEEKEKAANIAANKGAGEFDMPVLADIMGELAQISMDMDLTMFDKIERDSLVSADSFEEQGEPPERLDQTKPTICPSCGHEFFKS